MRKTLPVLIAAAALGLAALTGCSGEQSVADACKNAQTTVAEVSSELSTAMSKAGSGDASAAGESIDKIAAAITKAEGNATNTKVKEALNKLGGDMADLSAELKKATDPAAMAARADKIQQVSQNLQADGSKLDAICSKG